MPNIIARSSDDWSIETLEFGNEAVLICQDGDPRVAPGFGGLDDLGNGN